MKKMLIVAVMLLGQVARADWEFKENPDKYPSLGLNYTGSYLNYPVLNETVTQKSLVADARLPISEHFTLYLGIGSITGALSTPAYWGGNDTFLGNGVMFNLGFRVYFFNHN